VKTEEGWKELELVRKAWRVVLERYAKFIFEKKRELPYIPAMW